MKVSDKELKDYMAGRVQLVTKGKSGQSRFVPYKKRAYDRGITPQEKRAYWRVWYLKHRDERRAYERARKAKGIATNDLSKAQRVKLKAGTPQERHRLYMKQWRKDNKAHVAAYSRAKYIAKQAAKKGAKPKRTLLQRLLSWF